MSDHSYLYMDEEHVVIPEQTVAVIVPAAEVTLTPQSWTVERDGAYLGTVSLRGGTPPWLATQWRDTKPYSVMSTHQSRDEAIAAILAGTTR